MSIVIALSAIMICIVIIGAAAIISDAIKNK